MIACITLVAFLFTSIPADLVRASDVTSRSIGSAIKNIDLASFSLPPELGTVQASWSSPSLPTIIHIQDAHCNYNAQRKIADIISYLNKTYGIDTVNLEGGKGDYDLSIFKAIGDNAKREQVADRFAKEGLINGAEYFAATNIGKVTLWGVEDDGLYLENLRIYRRSLRHKDEIDRYLKTVSRILSNLKIHIYSKDLLEFDAKYAQHKAGNLEFKVYVSALLALARSRGINTEPYADLMLLGQVIDNESEIDFAKANGQRDQLIESLRKALSYRETEELLRKTVEFSSGKMRQAAYYSYIHRKAEEVGIDTGAFPEFRKYLAYIGRFSNVDNSKVMDEVAGLEKEIRAVLCENDAQRELDLLSRNLAVTRNMFNVTLTKNDYRYYISNGPSFTTARYASFIGREALRYKVEADLGETARNIDRYRDEITKFYELSMKRDEAFMRNIRFQGPDKRVAVVITGGFHGENLCELFKKSGISYVSIMPNFRNENGYACPYFKLLAGNPYAEFLKTAQSLGLSALAIASNLNQLGKLAAAETGKPIGIEKPVEALKSAPASAPATLPMIDLALDDSASHDLAVAVNTALGGSALEKHFPYSIVTQRGEYTIEADSSPDRYEREYVRVERLGPLVFVVLNQRMGSETTAYAKEAASLRAKLAEFPEFRKHQGNVLLVAPTYYDGSTGLPLGYYALNAIANIISYAGRFQDAVVIDEGSGDGLLARIALRFGASRAVLVDKDAENLHRARLLLAEDGLGERAENDKRFTLLAMDLTDPVLKSLLKTFIIPGTPLIALANIGPHYDEGAIRPNDAALELVADSPELELVINGGHLTAVDEEIEYERGDTDAVKYRNGRENAERILSRNGFAVTETGVPYTVIIGSRLFRPGPVVTPPEVRLSIRGVATIIALGVGASISGIQGLWIFGVVMLLDIFGLWDKAWRLIKNFHKERFENISDNKPTDPSRRKFLLTLFAASVGSYLIFHSLPGFMIDARAQLAMLDKVSQYRFYFSDYTEICRNRVNHKPDGRPLAVVIYPKDTEENDWNGALRQGKSMFHAFIKHGYRVMYFEASDATDGLNYLVYATREQSARVIIFGGHGAPEGITYNHRELSGYNEPVLSGATLGRFDLRKLKDCIEENGVVILNSCSQGFKFGDLPNTADEMRAAFPTSEMILAPQLPDPIKEVIFDKNDRVVGLRHFKGPTYTNSASAFTNSVKKGISLAIAVAATAFMTAFGPMAKAAEVPEPIAPAVSNAITYTVPMPISDELAQLRIEGFKKALAEYRSKNTEFDKLYKEIVDERGVRIVFRNVDYGHPCEFRMGMGESGTIYFDLAQFDGGKSGGVMVVGLAEELYHAKQCEWVDPWTRHIPNKWLRGYFVELLLSSDIAMTGRAAIEKPAFDYKEKIREELALPQIDTWKSLSKDYSDRRLLDIVRPIVTSWPLIALIVLLRYAVKGMRKLVARPKPGRFKTFHDFAGGTKARPAAAININDIAKEAHSLLEPEYQKIVRFELDSRVDAAKAPGASVWANRDVSRFATVSEEWAHQNVMDLIRMSLANALYFRDRPDLAITVRTFVTEDGKSAISISDNGPGMDFEKIKTAVLKNIESGYYKGAHFDVARVRAGDKKYLMSIFTDYILTTKPFVSSIMVLGKKESQGRGMTLGSMREIIRESKGAIKLETEEGKGTAVTFIFKQAPRVASASVEKPGSSDMSKERPHPERPQDVPLRETAFYKTLQNMLSGQALTMPAITPEMASVLMASQEGRDLRYNYDRIEQSVRYLFREMDPQERQIAFSFVQRFVDKLSVKDWNLNNFEDLCGMRALLRNLLIAAYNTNDVGGRFKRIVRGIAYGVGLYPLITEHAICVARLHQRSPSDYERVSMLAIPEICAPPEGVDARRYDAILATLFPHYYTYDARVRFALAKQVLHKMEPEGSQMVAYTAPDLPYVVKVMKKGGVNNSNQPLDFQRDIVTGTYIARTRLGGLAANVHAMANVKVRIDDRDVEFEDVLIQTKTMPLRNKLEELATRGDAEAVKEATRIIRKWWDLQITMWKRGVVDADIKLWDNYGYDAASDSVFIFDYTNISMDVKDFWNDDWSQNILDTYNIANLSMLNSIGKNIRLGDIYSNVRFDVMYENRVTVSGQGRDGIRVSVWPTDEQQASRETYIPLSEVFAVDSRELGMMERKLQDLAASGALADSATGNTELSKSLSSAFDGLIIAARKRRVELAGDRVDLGQYRGTPPVLAFPSNPDATGIVNDAVQVATFLAPRDPLPMKADAIIVFGNDRLETIFTVAQLVADGRSDMIVFSGGIGRLTDGLRAEVARYLSVDPSTLVGKSEAAMMKQAFDKEIQRFGLSDERLKGIRFLLEENSSDTQKNVLESRKELNKAGIYPQSVILVQQPLGQLRAMQTFKKNFGLLPSGNNVTAYSYAAYVPEPAHCSDPRYIQEIVSEAEKLEDYARPGKEYLEPLALEGAPVGKLKPDVRAAVDRLKIGARAPAKGILVSVERFLQGFGTDTKTPAMENFWIPAIEEGIMFFFLSQFGVLSFLGARALFVLLHTVQDRAPPVGTTRSLYEKIAIPLAASIAASLLAIVSTNISYALVAGLFTHMLGNTLVDTLGLSYQKGVAEDSRHDFASVEMPKNSKERRRAARDKARREAAAASPEKSRKPTGVIWFRSPLVWISLGTAIASTIAYFIYKSATSHHTIIPEDNLPIIEIQQQDMMGPPQDADIEAYAKRIKDTHLTLNQWLKDVLARNSKSLILIGDVHTSLAVKQTFRTEILPALKANNVTMLILENIPSDMQELVDIFNKDGTVHPAIQGFLQHNARALMLPPDTSIAIMKEARKNGMTVLAAGTTIKESFSGSHYDDKFVIRMFGRQKDVLVNVIKDARKKNPGAKMAVFMGAGHNDNIKDQVYAAVDEPILSFDILDPGDFIPAWDNDEASVQLKMAAGDYRASFFFSRMIDGAKKLGIERQTWVSRPVHKQLADWVVYLGEVDYHNIKDGWEDYRLMKRGSLRFQMNKTNNIMESAPRPPAITPYNYRKGILVSAERALQRFGIDTKTPAMENFWIPAIEEGIMFFFLSQFGVLSFLGVRTLFVLLHTIQDRAPPVGTKRTLYEKIAIPLAASIAAGFFAIASTNISYALITGLATHMLGNTLVDTMRMSYQKGVVSHADESALRFYNRSALLQSYVPRDLNDTLRWLVEHRNELGGNSLGYLVRSLSVAGRLPDGANPQTWEFSATAYDFYLNSPLLQSYVPSDLDNTLRWLVEHIAELGGNSLAYLVQALSIAGKLPDGADPLTWHFSAGAYDFYVNSPLLQSYVPRDIYGTLHWLAEHRAKLGGNSFRYLMQSLFIAGRLPDGADVQSWYRSAAAYDFYLNSPLLQSYTPVNLENTLRWLAEHRAELGDNSLGYLVQALFVAGRLPNGADSQTWQRSATAYDFYLNSPLLQSYVPSDLNDTLRWLAEHRTDLGGNSLAYLVQALSVAGRLPDGTADQTWRRFAGAYDFYLDSALLQTYVPRDRNDTLRWLAEHRAELGGSSLTYLVQALSIAGRLPDGADVQSWSFSAGAYDRALGDRRSIVGEIDRIWSETSNDGTYQTDLSRLYALFDPALLPNLNTGAPLSRVYRKSILKYAYIIYGRDRIAEIVRAQQANPPAQIGKRAPAKGILISVERFLQGFGIDTKTPAMENFWIPAIEEGIMFFFLSQFGVLSFLGARTLFVLLHTIQDRAPPIGTKRSLYEKIAIPLSASIAASFFAIASTNISYALVAGLFTHMLGNTLVDTLGLSYQKAVVKGSSSRDLRKTIVSWAVLGFIITASLLYFIYWTVTLRHIVVSEHALPEQIYKLYHNSAREIKAPEAVYDSVEFKDFIDKQLDVKWREFIKNKSGDSDYLYAIENPRLYSSGGRHAELNRLIGSPFSQSDMSLKAYLGKVHAVINSMRKEERWDELPIIEEEAFGLIYAFLQNSISPSDETGDVFANLKDGKGVCVDYSILLYALGKSAGLDIDIAYVPMINDYKNITLGRHARNILKIHAGESWTALHLVDLATPFYVLKSEDDIVNYILKHEGDGWRTIEVMSNGTFALSPVSDTIKGYGEYADVLVAINSAIFAMKTANTEQEKNAKIDKWMNVITGIMNSLPERGIDKSDKFNAILLNLLATLSVNKNDLVSARRYYDDSIKVGPDDYFILLHAADFYRNIGDLKQAQELFKRAYERALKDHKEDTANKLLEVYIMQGEDKKAEPLIRNKLLIRGSEEEVNREVQKEMDTLRKKLLKQGGGTNAPSAKSSAQIGKRAPAKGILLSVERFLQGFGIDTKTPSMENFWIPAIEEGIMFFFLSQFGVLSFLGARTLFVLLHTIQDRAPPIGTKRSLYEKIAIPIAASIAASFFALASTNISYALIAGLFTHMLGNTLVDTLGWSYQKGVVEGEASNEEKILNLKAIDIAATQGWSTMRQALKNMSYVDIMKARLDSGLLKQLRIERLIKILKPRFMKWIEKRNSEKEAKNSYARLRALLKGYAHDYAKTETATFWFNKLRGEGMTPKDAIVGKNFEKRFYNPGTATRLYIDVLNKNIPEAFDLLVKKMIANGAIEDSMIVFHYSSENMDSPRLSRDPIIIYTKDTTGKVLTKVAQAISEAYAEDPQPFKLAPSDRALLEQEMLRQFCIPLSDGPLVRYVEMESGLEPLQSYGMQVGPMTSAMFGEDSLHTSRVEHYYKALEKRVSAHPHFCGTFGARSITMPAIVDEEIEKIYLQISNITKQRTIHITEDNIAEFLYLLSRILYEMKLEGRQVLTIEEIERRMVSDAKGTPLVSGAANDIFHGRGYHSRQADEGLRQEDIDRLVDMAVKGGGSATPGQKELPAPQIGKRASAEFTPDKKLRVIDSAGKEHLLDLFSQGPLHVDGLASHISNAYLLLPEHEKAILFILSLLEKSPPELFMFNALIEDLFGVASPRDGAIAVHESLVRNPVALFHEVAEYLVASGKLEIDYDSSKQVVRLIDPEHRASAFEIRIPDSDIEVLRLEAWWDKESNDIKAEFADRRPHYCLRMLQHEVFTLANFELTSQIKKAQATKESRPIQPKTPSAPLPSVARPLADPAIIKDGDVNTILVFAPNDKLGESVIDVWPLVSSLHQRFPKATIYVATDYPDHYFSEYFDGRVKPIPTGELKTLKGQPWGRKWSGYSEKEWSEFNLENMKKGIWIKEFVLQRNIDMVFDVYPVAPIFAKISAENYPQGKAPYVFSMQSPAKSIWGSKPEFYHARSIMNAPRFKDRAGVTYEVSGFDAVLDSVAPDNKVVDSGVWRYAIEMCYLLGLNVKVDGLDVLKPTLKEKSSALTLLKEWHARQNEFGEPFDPLKKVFVINVYAKNNFSILSDQGWARLIQRLLEETDAYLVFTRGGQEEFDSLKLEKILALMPGDRSRMILIPRQDIYPAISDILGIADWVLTPDTGTAHLASGVYNKYILDIARLTSIHWGVPREDTVQYVFADNQAARNMQWAAQNHPEIFEKFGKNAIEMVEADSIDRIIDNAKTVSEQPVSLNVLSGKLAALSMINRAKLDREALEKFRLSYPDAEEDIVRYVKGYLGVLGLSEALIPKIAFVDSATQIGIDDRLGHGASRFKVKLYQDGSDTYLLVDKSALIQGVDGGMEVRQNIKDFDILHEILGHMFVRANFPEFAEINRKAIQSGIESKEVLIAKAEEEVLARLMTLLLYRRMKDMVPGFENKAIDDRVKALNIDLSIVDLPLYVRQTIKRILSIDDDLNVYKYRRVLEDDTKVDLVIAGVISKMEQLDTKQPALNYTTGVYDPKTGTLKRLQIDRINSEIIKDLMVGKRSPVFQVNVKSDYPMEQVEVQVWTNAPESNSPDLVAWHAIPLSCVFSENGDLIYEGSFVPVKDGKYEYTIRIAPKVRPVRVQWDREWLWMNAPGNNKTFFVHPPVKPGTSDIEGVATKEEKAVVAVLDYRNAAGDQGRSPVDINAALKAAQKRLEPQHSGYVKFEENTEGDKAPRALVETSENDILDIIRLCVANSLYFRAHVTVRSFTTEDGRPAISISDDGPGINFSMLRNAVISAIEKGWVKARTVEQVNTMSDEELLPMVFNDGVTTKFARGMTTVMGANESQGRGMGLGVAADIIRRSRGTIRIESRNEIGTTFTFIFESATAGAPPAQPKALTAGAEKSIGEVYSSAKDVLVNTRYPDEPRVICIPVSEKICPTDAVRNKVQGIWKDLRPAVGGRGFHNITVLFYDGTLKNLNEKLSGLAATGKTFNKANILAYIDASAAEREPGHYAVLADMKAKGQVTMVREAIPQEGTYISVGGHVILALGILDIVRNGRSDPDYISLVANLAAAMSDGQPGTKAEEFRELLKKGDIAGIVIRLPPAKKLDINGDMESHFLMEETAMKSL